MTEREFPEGWRSLKLSKISVSLLEHLVEPILGKKVIDLIKEPVEKKELLEKLYDSFRASENQFRKAMDNDIGEVLLSLDLRDSKEVRESLYEFYQNPLNNHLERIFVEEVINNAPYLSKARILEAVHSFLSTLQENLIASTPSEYREKIVAYLLIGMHKNSDKSLAELQQMNLQLKQLITFFIDNESSQSNVSPYSPTENKGEATDINVDFLLITALPEERDAILSKLPEYQQLPPVNDDIRTYFQANLPVTFSDKSVGYYHVVINCLLGMGRIQAVAATGDAIRRWHPRYVLLVGIAGGIAARNVLIGDILISDQIVDYELQKLTPEGPQYRWNVHRTDARLLNACNNFSSENWRELIKIKRPGRGKPKCHIGPIASGDKVIAVSDVIEKFQNTWPKLIGVEMEAAGAATAAFQSPENPGFFMIRCVSDLADENKGSRDVKRWRSYACDAAASYTIALLRNGPVPTSQPRIYSSDRQHITEGVSVNTKEKSVEISNSDQQNKMIRDHIQRLVEDPSTNFSAEIDGIGKSRFFVGRQNEYLVIKTCYELMKKDNSPQFTLIQGDFGTGKTALIGNFVKSIKDSDKQVIVWSRCVEQEEYSGWVPFIQLFRVLLKKVLQSGVFDKLEIFDYLITRTPAWIKLVFPEIDDNIFKTTGYKQDVIHAQFLNFICKISEKLMIIFVIDDIQWADISSLNLLSYLTSELKNIPFFFLVAYRTEGLKIGLNPEALQRTCNDVLLNPNAHLIELKEGIDTRDYICKRYQMDFVPEAIIEKIDRFSDGHALFIDQLFDHWQEERIIVRDISGKWILAPDVARELEIPRTVEGVLDLRARKMKDEYREILKFASIEGDDFTVQILSRLATIEEEDLIDKLQDISDQYRLIGEKGPERIRDFTFDFYHFMHRFFREHFYHRLDNSKKRRLHQKIGEYLETLHIDRENIAGRLAYHFYYAGSLDKSIDYSLLAAQEATKSYKWIEVTEWCKLISKQLFDLIKNSSKVFNEKAEYLNVYAESLILWIDACENTGNFDIAEEILNDVVKKLRQQPKNEFLYARILVAYGKQCYCKNDSRGIDAVQQAIKIFQDFEDKNGEYRAKCVLADFLVDFCNLFEEGILLQEELVDFAEKYISLKEKIDNLALLAWSLLYVGKYDRAVQSATEAYQLVMNQPYQDPNSVGLVLRMIGYCYYKWGHLRNAKRYQKEAVNKYHEIGDYLSEYWTRLEFGYTLQALGEFNEAIKEYDDCLRFAKHINDFQIQEWVNITLAKISICQGNMEHARGYLQTSTDLLNEYEKSLEDQITVEMTLVDYYFTNNDLGLIPDVLEKISNLLISYHSEISNAQLNTLYGRYFHKIGKSQLALEYLNKSLGTCFSLHVCIPTAITCNIIRKVYLDIGNLEKAEEYLLKVNDNLAKVSSPWVIDDLEDRMIEWIF